MDDDVVPAGYEFIRVLGSGGFGEVVLARHLVLNRLVAVKRIHAVALADAESVARFRREARLLATLDCPSVVRVYDLVVGPSRAHLVMEYVPGQALSDLLARGPLPAAEALPILRDAADALRVAAARGIVHRDVKPHNVFVMPDGRAKLGDFGLARAVSDPGVFRTSVGTALGTPAYYPPELGRGDGEPDERSDAYSFAVVAFETLTGRRPYDETDAIALITAHWRLDPPDPREVLPGIPARAAEALLSGLSKEPGRRPLPADLVKRLAAVPAAAWPTVQRRPPEPVAAHRTAPTVLVQEPAGSAAMPGAVPRSAGARGRRRLVAVGAVCAAALLGGAVAWGLLRSPVADETVEVRSIELRTTPEPATVQCPRAEIQLHATFVTSGTQGAFDIRWTGPDGQELGERKLTVEDGQRTVESRLSLTLSGQQPLRGPATVAVVATGLRASKPVVYRCAAR